MKKRERSFLFLSLSLSLSLSWLVVDEDVVESFQYDADHCLSSVFLKTIDVVVFSG